MSSILLADNGVSSGAAGLKSSADGTGTLALQTTTASGTATTAVLIDNAQNVGVGVTPSAWNTTSYRVLEFPYGVSLFGQTDGASAILATNGFLNSSYQWIYKTTAAATYYQQTTGQHRWYNAPSGTAGNAITFTQAMTLDASGNLLVGTTSNSENYKVNVKFNGGGTNGLLVQSTAGSGDGSYALGLARSYAVNNTIPFLSCTDTSAVRAEIRNNGGIANYSANNVNLSDRREKTNFAPAGDYLAKICAIPVQTYNYIDQNMEEDDGLTLGVVAQDVQAVAPELVTESDWSTEKDGSKMRLSIYQTDMQYVLMKCIQEQQSLIQSLTDRLTALEGAAK